MSDYITEDALIQILQHLPARNLVRLRVVCKSWKELIDSDELMLKHLDLQKPGFLVDYGATKYVAVEIGCHPPLTHDVRRPIQGLGRWISFIGTHHGIVCLDDGDRNVYLWNPSTGKHSTILLPENFSFGVRRCCKSFRIDPLTKEYQIVILFFKDVSRELRANGILYSSVERDWSVVPEQRIKHFFGGGGHDVLVGGVAYWTDDLLENALSFDFNEKTVKLIKLPSRNVVYGSPTGEDELIEFGDPIKLIQWNGAFSALCYAANCNDKYEINTWTEGYWTSILRFEIPSPKTSTLLAMVETDKRSWVLYNMNRHDLCVYEIGVGHSHLMRGGEYAKAHDFVESLLFP